jgi:hypothetical protein
MADVKISALPPASTPLAGTEVLPIVQSGATKKVANNDLRPTQIQSNATSGVLQVVGPAAASTRVMTTPDANFTVARTDAAQTFTGTQTVLTAATQDAVALAGRAGGTSSYVSTITPTTLSASRTVTLPDANTTVPVATQVLTFSGPSAARTITLPDANFTAARTDAAQTFTGVQQFSSTMLASYLWDQWNPSDVTGTTTNAPSTGTTDDSDYVTMSNSSGTLTITFDVAGSYLISLQESTAHAQSYVYDTFYMNLGGTATRRNGRDTLENWGDSVNDGNLSIGFSFLVKATASQTLTILPQYRVNGAGTTANHNARAGVSVQYCGG